MLRQSRHDSGGRMTEAATTALGLAPWSEVKKIRHIVSTRAKTQERVPAACVPIKAAKEALRQEGLRLRPQPRVPMDAPHVDEDVGALGDAETAHLWRRVRARARNWSMSSVHTNLDIACTLPAVMAVVSYACMMSTSRA